MFFGWRGLPAASAEVIYVSMFLLTRMCTCEIFADDVVACVRKTGIEVVEDGLVGGLLVGLTRFMLAGLRGTAAEAVAKGLGCCGRTSIDVVDSDGGDEALADVAVFVYGIVRG